MPVVDDIAGLARILTRSRVIAVVGLSPNWYRPSFFAAKYMQEHGYRVVPVNPKAAEILGERSYPSVDAIPGDVDIVIQGKSTHHPGRGVGNWCKALRKLC
jgi:predicted CoA-binding protein